MGMFTLESSRRGTLRVRVITNGLMENAIKEIGATTRCMGQVFSLGQMAENTRVSTRKTRNMVKGAFSGPILEAMKASGLMEDSMERAIILRVQANLSERVFGEKE